MSNELIRLHYEVESGDFLRGGESSSSIKKILSQLGVHSKIIKRVCVACYEAEMNIVIHSYGGVMDAFIYENNITIICKDKGPGIKDLSLAMTEGYSTASEDAQNMGFGAGMGLPNIKRNADELKIISQRGDGTEIKMVINL